MRTVTVRGVALGAGRAKIAVPLVGETRENLLSQAAALAALPADLAEWRVDFYETPDDEAALLDTLRRLREALGELPLLFTLRTAEEGGGARLPPADYAARIRAAAQSGSADLVDVELSHPRAAEAMDAVHAAGLPVVGSRHDCRATPPAEAMLAYLREAQKRGADIPKLAVTPRSDADVFALLEAATQFRDRYADRPFIAISMGARGAISRAACGLTGSCLTFGAAESASAPGQLPAAELARMLGLLSKDE